MDNAVTFDARNANYGGGHPPRVSIIAIFLNEESFIAEAIESVLAQTFDDWELLLVDDGSDDASTAIAQDYASQYPNKIYYSEHPEHANRGMSPTRNFGIAQARGEYIAFIDADDVWIPRKLADQVAILDKHFDVGMVCGTAVYWSSWFGAEDRIAKSGHKQDCVVVPPDATLKLYPLGHGNSPCSSDLLLRATVVRDIGGFEEHFGGQNQLYEDQAFLAKLYLEAPIYIASNIWLKYRRHSKSCVTLVMATGKYHDIRQYFLNWLEGYVATIPDLDDRTVLAIQRAQRRYRHPNIDFLLTLPERIYWLLRRSLAFLARRIRSFRRIRYSLEER